MSESEIGSTFDLLRNPAVIAELGEKTASDALFNALKEARMNIAESNCEAVIEIIGEVRAKECKSLPKYKERFGSG